MPLKIYNYLQDTIAKKGAAYLILIDPDKLHNNISKFIKYCSKAGVDALLIGGSLMINGDQKATIEKIKKYTSIPIIIFPGSIEQISQSADALFYISLISSRNADQIIGKHVLAAPLIKKIGIEPISTGYILVESGKITTAEYLSDSRPVPRNKPEIAASTALAAEYLGMKFIYLEAGSGAELSVPNEMVKMVSTYCSIPVIVGGGIRDAKTAREKVESGAKIIVTGNYFEDEQNWNKMKSFSDAVHIKEPKEV